MSIVPAEAGTRVHLGYGITLDVLHPGPEPTFRKGSASVPAYGELDLTANSLVLLAASGAWGVHPLVVRLFDSGEI